MEASAIRERILQDHEVIRRHLARVDALARRALAGESGLEAELREAGEALSQRFLAHLALEDAHLVPALRESDAWGEERAARVEHEHREQRAQLDQLLADLRDGRRSGAQLAQELLDLVNALVADMEHEERAVLDPEVLRDDVVGVGVEGG
jgi:iron-sulfur cluster repair protein YtfE (RIC family)